MLKQTLLTVDQLKKIQTLLKSKAGDEAVYWDVYGVFHDGRGLGPNEERVTIFGEHKGTMSYHEEFDLYHMYDSSNNGAIGGYTRAELLQHVSELLKAPQSKKVPAEKSELEKANAEIKRLQKLLKANGISFKPASIKPLI